MTNFNYFSLCNASKGAAAKVNTRAIIGAGVAVVVLGVVVYGFFGAQVLLRNSQLSFVQRIQQDPLFTEQHKQSLAMTTNADIAQKDLAFLENLEGYYDKISTANLDLFNLINNAVVGGAKIVRFSIADKTVTLEGTAPNIDVVTTIEKNFRQTGKFISVLISTVNHDDSPEAAAEPVKFSGQLVLDGGAIINESK